MKIFFAKKYQLIRSGFIMFLVLLSLMGTPVQSVFAQPPLFGSSGGTSGGTTSGPMCPTKITSAPANFREFVCLIGGILNSLLPIVAGMTLLVFFWGLATSIRNAGDPKEVEKGKLIMKWGIIGLFVMVSFIGIINLFTGDFFGTTYGIPKLPE